MITDNNVKVSLFHIYEGIIMCTLVLSKQMTRGHPCLSTFSQAYKPYSRGGGKADVCFLDILNNEPVNLLLVIKATL